MAQLHFWPGIMASGHYYLLNDEVRIDGRQFPRLRKNYTKVCCLVATQTSFSFVSVRYSAKPYRTITCISATFWRTFAGDNSSKLSW